MNEINYLSFLITWNCNSRCSMCNIWKKNNNQKQEIDIKRISILFSDPCLKNLKEVVISGGEPFLRGDLLEILKVINKFSNASIGITTNGLLPDIILSTTRKALELKIPISLYVSLDGSNSNIYSSIRGLKNGFSIVIRTLKKLSKLKNEFNQLEVDIGTTILSQNLKDLLKIQKLVYSIDPNFGFGVRLAENNELFDNKSKKFWFDEKQKKYLIKILNKLKDGNIDFYYDKIIEFICNKKYPHFDCISLKKSLYVTPEGNITTCGRYLNTRNLGNISNHKIKDILNKNDNIKNDIKNCDNCLDPGQWSWMSNKSAI